MNCEGSIVTSGIRFLKRSTVPGMLAGENASGPIFIEGIRLRSAVTTLAGSSTVNCPAPTSMMPKSRSSLSSTLKGPVRASYPVPNLNCSGLTKMRPSSLASNVLVAAMFSGLKDSGLISTFGKYACSASNAPGAGLNCPVPTSITPNLVSRLSTVPSSGVNLSDPTTISPKASTRDSRVASIFAGVNASSPIGIDPLGKKLDRYSIVASTLAGANASAGMSMLPSASSTA